jgi:hypothetical protein
MGLTEQVLSVVHKQTHAIKALAALSAHCESARELIVMKLGETNLGKLVEAPFMVDLLLSLSRGSKILKQILCEDKEIHAFLSEGLRTATAKAITEE